MLKLWFERALRQRWALPAILLGAGALLLLSELSHDRARAAFTETRIHRNANSEMMRLLQLMTDAETAQRGYVLTGNSDFLNPYRDALSEKRALLARVLKYLLEHGRGDAAEQLQKLIEAKMSEVQTTIDLYEAGNVEGARTLVLSGIGKEQMEDIRKVLSDVTAWSEASVITSRATLSQALTMNRFGIAALLTLAVLGLFLYLQQVRALDKAREGQRRFLQNERERLETEVARRTADLRELASHLQSAREDERASLARELHDELGALLTAAKLDVARLRSKLGDQPEQLARLAHLTQTLNDGIALKRRIIEDLRPSSLNNLGLTTALDILCREMSDRLGVPITAELEPLRLKPPADLTAYRFVQEALTNIGKYANASEVQVRLAAEDDAVALEVRDDGVGFDMTRSMVGHHGLTGMRFRVESIGGRMFVGSAPGEGTTLRAELPAGVVAPPAAAAAAPA
jgi:signal transduction histidine kinase